MTSDTPGGKPTIRERILRIFRRKERGGDAEDDRRRFHGE